MTPNEFKAWFDGFTEAFDRTPTQKQWARIKERVEQIDGKPTSQTVYVDRYWPSRYYGAPFGPVWAYAGMNSAGGMSSAQCAAQASSANLSANALSAERSNAFNSLAAMNSLGRMDAKDLAEA